MTSVDPRAPVIVGAGQVTHRDDSVEPAPLELMVKASRRAAQDSGTPALLRRVQSLAAVEVVSWPVPDPGRAVAEELGADPEETVRTARGGSGPVELLGDLCTRIADGRLECVLLVGGEAFNPFMRATREGRDTGWPQQPGDTAPDRVVGVDRPASHPAEQRVGLIAPIAYYPLFESAVRGAAGRDLDAHQEWLVELWGRFADVARGNPDAWSADPPRRHEIASVGDENRMVAFPYPKLMTANIQVDQSAALLLCSAGAAMDAGVPPERGTFVHATAGAHDRWFAGERQALHRSPALAACTRAVFEHAGLGLDDVAHIDLYSCFPSAVQMAAGELGLDLPRDARPPTVTGGLTFAGGPANNYVTHALATLADRLRQDGGTALVTGVGWYMTKHAVAILGSEPPKRPFRHAGVQEQVDRMPGRELAHDARAQAQIEAYTAVYDRAGTPTMAIAACLLDDGRRALARSEEPATISAVVEGDSLGRPAALGPDASFRLDGDSVGPSAA